MNLIIKRLDGTEYDFSQYGKVIDFQVHAPSPKHTTDEVEGRNGFVDMGTTYEGRSLSGSFQFYAVDGYDYALQRNEIFKMFYSREPFYLIDTREPAKRWLVKCDSSFNPEQLTAKAGEMDISFISASPFSESIGTTLDPFTFDAELWQIGQGLTTEDVQYIHHVTSFSIYNAGLPINPRNTPLKIKYSGPSANLKIKNTTTGTEWAYMGDSNEGDIILLDGIRSTKNGLSIFRDSNKKLITLDTGWNDFVLTGTSGAFEISFEHRFYYL